MLRSQIKGIKSIQPFTLALNLGNNSKQNRVEYTSMNINTKITNYSEYINSKSLKRYPSLIRELTKKLGTAEPGTIFMAGGLPNPSLFPFQSIQVKLDDQRSLFLDEKDLRAALQYQPTTGYPPLVEQLKKLIEHYFSPPNLSELETIVTVGSQNGLSTAVEMILEEGDAVVIPKPVYSSAIAVMEPYSPIYLTVQEDSDGMNPIELKSTLEGWYSSKGCIPGDPKAPKNRPKMLYVNPTAANPSGTVIPTQRKKEIYEIARQYDLLILEDDPYYFLHFEKENPTTFLSLDVDGRVIRLDSFSKVLSSGLRVGFATGHKSLIRHMELSLQASILHASSISQVLVTGILKDWGIPGLERHTDRVKSLYKRRRDLMITSAETHLKGLAEWDVPGGGMFLWIKILGVQDTFNMVMEHGLSQKIMLLPGREFMTERNAPCPFLRASYSVLPEEHIDPGIQRLASLIRDEQKRQ